MATDARLSVAGRDFNAGAIISQGQATGERFRTQGVREQILNQNAQIGQQSIEQNQRTQVLNGITHGSNVLKGILSVPVANRPALMAQNLSLLTEAGIPVEEFTSLDLTNDQAITDKINSFGLMAKAASNLPAGVQEFNALTEGLSEEDAMKARRVKLGLDPRAVASAPKLVTVGGAQFLQIGTEFFNPTTTEPVEVDQVTGLPTGGGNVVLTPDVQAEQEAEAAAATTTATSEAAAEVELATADALAAQDLKNEIERKTALAASQSDLDALDPEKAELRAKQKGMAEDAISAVDELLGSNLDRVTGWAGKTATARPATQDILNVAQRLNSMLTAENMGIMSGVLSETDIKIIQDLASGLGFENGKGFNGTKEGTIKRLGEIKVKLEEAISRKESFGKSGAGETITSKTGITFTVRDN